MKRLLAIFVGVFALGVLFAPAAYAQSQPVGPAVAVTFSNRGYGYRVAYAGGDVVSYDTSLPYGALVRTSGQAPVVGMVATPDDQGYWLVTADGGVFCYGDAKFYGSAAGRHLNSPIVGMGLTTDGRGYWLLGADGGVFAYGDAPFYGVSRDPSGPKAVSISNLGNVSGYQIAFADGSVVSIENGHGGGSTTSMTYNAPIVAMVADPAIPFAYWQFAADGGVFSVNGAPFLGSLGNSTLVRHIVAMAATPDGKGYVLLFSTGELAFFGDAAPQGLLCCKQ